MSVVVIVWGSVGMFVVYRPLLKIVFFNLGVLESMLYVCVRCVMDVVFSILYGKCECRHADVVCLCLVCILWQFSMLHDLQFVNAGRGCKRRPYGSHECFLLFAISCCCACFYHV